MKGILCACLLVSIHSIAGAYESDIHYSTTYVLARAVGWAQADALTIASANQAVDENQATVAALEADTIAGPSLASYFTNSFHQAQKNLQLHCFGRTAGRAGQLSADVVAVIAHHFAGIPARDDDGQSHARRLIALGTALHCQQDAYAHAGFGGSCGSYPGSCYGHSYLTALDRVLFGLRGKHYFDPDHPGVSGQQLLKALSGTASELGARRAKDSSSSVPADALVALVDALRGSGLELPDQVRRDCNRFIAGKWLFDFLHSRDLVHGGPDALQTLRPEVAVTCRNAALGSATIVSIPAPRFPRLNADGSPYLVRTDGSYQLAGDADPLMDELARLSAVTNRKVARQISLGANLPLGLPVPPP